MENMTIKEYFELVKNESEIGQFDRIINDDIDKFCSPDMVKAFESLLQKTYRVSKFWIEDMDGDISILQEADGSTRYYGNLGVYDEHRFFWGYYPDDTPMVEVFDDLYKKMNGEVEYMKTYFEILKKH